jgi:phosphoglycolate phosphatase
MTRLVLFDIDGTLVLTGGAGLRALNLACEELVGHTDVLAGVPLAGRTDRIIIHDAMAKVGHAMDEDLFEALKARYLTHLEREIDQPGRGTKSVMPGVRDLLETLHRRDDVLQGLLTGNFEDGARIKLGHFGLWQYFRCGAFGDDAADRNALVPFALRRARACGLADVTPDRIFVVGDTPHDIACARAVGAVPIGVATGGFTARQLRDTDATAVFEDLRDTDAFLQLLR